MGGCLSAPAHQGHGYSSKHSSANGGGAAAPYAGYSAYARPPAPDFGISSCYEVHRLLGEGGTGQTWLCKEAATGNLYAVKLIKRPIPRVIMPMLRHEIQIQARLGRGHVSLVQAHEVVLSRSHLGIVMQYAAGGTLTQYVSDRWSTTDQRGGLFLSEDEARFVFLQVLAATDYLHGHHVAHRDLKLDNIVLTDDFPPRIKLCDFGFAKDWDASSNMRTVIGTPVYMAPEVIGSKRHTFGYDAPKAELWACGVLLFVMLLGMFPFDHVENPDPNSSQAQVEVWMEQKRGNWRNNDRVGTAVRRLSPDCLDLLEKIFVVEESRRISEADIRVHPWLCQPLSIRFQRAWDKLRAEQALVHERATTSKVPQSIPGLDSLLERACHMGAAGDAPLLRIELAQPPQQQALPLATVLSQVVEASEASSFSTWTARAPSSALSATLCAAPSSAVSLPAASSMDSAASVAQGADASAGVSPSAGRVAGGVPAVAALPSTGHHGWSAAAVSADDSVQHDQGYYSTPSRYGAAASTNASNSSIYSHSTTGPPSQRGTPTQISSLYALSSEA